MMLPIRRGAVAVESQRLGDGGDVIGEHAGCAGKGGRDLGDFGLVARMVIPAGDQCLAGWRAKRGGVELVVQQPVFGEFVEVRRLHDAAGRAGPTEAQVIEQDDDHVGRILWCFDFEHRRCLGIPRIKCRDRRIPRSLQRKFRAVDLSLFLGTGCTNQDDDRDNCDCEWMKTFQHDYLRWLQISRCRGFESPNFCGSLDGVGSPRHVYSINTGSLGRQVLSNQGCSGP